MTPEESATVIRGQGDGAARGAGRSQRAGHRDCVEEGQKVSASLSFSLIWHSSFGSCTFPPRFDRPQLVFSNQLFQTRGISREVGDKVLAASALGVRSVSDLSYLEDRDIAGLQLPVVDARKLGELVRDTKLSKTATDHGKALVRPKKFGDGPRVAICIGNNNYEGNNQLPNCEADAEDMAACLRGLGFSTVIVLCNANHAEMMRGIRELRDQHVKDGSLVVVFFSGHGVELAGVNYLLPVGMPADIPLEDYAEAAVSVDTIMKYLSRFTGVVNVLLLDCCRENELNDTFKAAKAEGSSDGTAKGMGKNLRNVNKDSEYVVGHMSGM